MTRTVDDLRNEIRDAVGRFQRIESTGFTKETLAAICAAVDYDIETDPLPPTSRMRAGIRWKTGLAEDDRPNGTGRPFRKAELQTILQSVREAEGYGEKESE